MRVTVICILASAAFMTGCKDESGSQLEMLTNNLKARPIGNGQDYWLMQKSKVGFDRVALVFGYYNDLEACTELAEALNVRFRKALYSCQPAN